MPKKRKSTSAQSRKRLARIKALEIEGAFPTSEGQTPRKKQRPKGANRDAMQIKERERTEEALGLKRGAVIKKRKKKRSKKS